MKSLIVYSSVTGNTKKIAEGIRDVFPPDTEIYPVEAAPAADAYDFIAVGFWVTRGTADPKAQAYLQSINNKQVALFGTLGAYPDSEHARESMRRAAALLNASNRLVGTFMCQGKVSPVLLERLNNLPAGHSHALTPERQARHLEASKHPNSEDIENAKRIFADIVAGGDGFGSYSGK